MVVLPRGRRPRLRRSRPHHRTGGPGRTPWPAWSPRADPEPPTGGTSAAHAPSEVLYRLVPW